MRPHLEAASDFFQQACKTREGKCMCHCSAGINRSGFVAVALLLLHERRDVLDAVRYVKQARGNCLLNASFQVQLLELAREKGLLGARPDQCQCLRQLLLCFSGCFEFGNP